MATGRNAVFLSSLREHQMLAPAQLDELAQQPLAQGDDLQAFGRLVLQKGWLTRFQINLVAQGRAKDLLLGPYRLLDRLGEGGMGQVFKAQHQVMNRLVALKVIRPERLANATAVQRFFREVQVAAKLHHPHIVLAFDAGQVDKTHYFAMEYVEGSDLARLVKESGPLPVAAACDCVRQAALGLQHAFEHGLVHRDIKPSNLILAPSAGASSNATSSAQTGPIVKILDMGLARLGNGEGATSLTQDGAVIGTPDYIAPEQALDARSADIRSDLYSLGGTLFFLLTGRPPFQGGTLTEMLLKHQMEAPPPVTTLRPEVSAEVAGILACLLAKRPEDRFQTPAELAHALTAPSQGHTDLAAVGARRAPTSEWSELTTDSQDRPGPRSSAKFAGERTAVGAALEHLPKAKPAAGMERGRRQILVLAGGGLALVGVLVALFLALRSPAPKPVQVVAANLTEPTARQPLSPPTEPAKPPPPEEPRPGPPAVPGPAGSYRIRQPIPPVVLAAGETKTLAVWVDRTDHRQPITIRATQLPAGVKVAPGILAPDQDRVDLTISTAADTPAAKTKFFIHGEDRGRTIGGPGISLIITQAVAVAPAPPKSEPPPAGGPELWRIDTPERTTPNFLYFSPDGRRALTFLGPQAWWLDVATGKVLRKLDQPENQGGSGALLPDGRRALIRNPDSTLRVWDLDTGQVLRDVAPVPPLNRFLTLTPDGKTFFLGRQAVVGNKAVDQDVCIRVMDLETGQELRRLTGLPAAAMHAAVSADGRRLLAAIDKNLAWWDVGSGKLLGQQTTPSPVQSVAISADGRRGLAGCSARTLQEWDLDTGREAHQLADLPGVVFSIVWLADGRHIVTANGNGQSNMGLSTYQDCTIGLWDTTTWKVLRKWSGHEQPVHRAIVSADGRYILSGGQDRTLRLWDLSRFFPPAAAKPMP